ncbi:type I-F CRISPR-associated endoribonuclease Cas6/Csy4 [Vibrio viridaestus]|uniref:Type I-F CRISPR-associated endoribonuclease Cas6/Csy4 n=1 Tax=Vibrio viridaestus TaxID=2487322 RepID=A0A3N9TLI8_9VIBR|nr:type I-F CRISPR-associated endoribonuclease Cas6/Csy4 [Vibrio viridaestus]RQW65147.1 type I-F CRISPR-associated endoribonuclease Cas6/Csy4 [Vibrio viridaestus]
MDWYYKTVTFLPKHRSNEALVAKCLKTLHGFNYHYNTRGIGVSFPLWSQETIGEKITFVSQNKMELDYLLSQQYFKEMVNLNYFHISSTKLVPKTCEYVAFRRNQKIDDSTPNGQARIQRRCQKRAIERGETYDPTTRDISSEHIFEHYHSIESKSTRKGQNFRLNIQMINAGSESNSAIFTSYGLSSKDNNWQQVPLI